jgi:hypothetical protein
VHVAPVFQRSALATAVCLAMTPSYLLAEGWQRNIEISVDPSSERTLYGARYLEPLWQDFNSMFYSDLRGNFTNAVEANEANAGVGYRQLVGNNQWIAGGWVSGDTRSSLRDNRYWQVSGGLELLGEWFDARANGYYPLTDEQSIAPFPTGGFFEGNRLFTSTVIEEALAGVDGEVGVRIPNQWAEARLYAGGHHFEGEVAPDADGAKVRLELRPVQSMTLGVSYEYDDEFEDEVFFNLRYAFGYPFERRQRALSERMIQFAERDVDIVVTDRLPDDVMASAAIEHRTLLNDNVVHIDNTAAAGGDGSFERPYNTFASCFAGRCPSGSLVYVHAGDGTALGYDQTFVLNNNQQLIGQGFALFGIGGNAFPVLTPAAGDGVVLANFNEVAGLAINNAAGNGIVGNNITGFNIHDNRIGVSGGGRSGIEIGTFIAGNLTTTGAIANNIITAGGQNGQGVTLFNGAAGTGTATQTASLINNTITASGQNGQGVFLYNAALGTATQRATLTGNTVTANGQNGKGVTLFSGATGTGTAMQTATLADNTVTANGQNGYGVFLSNLATATATATQSATLTDNTVTASGQSGVGVFLSNFALDTAAATQSATLTDNTVTASGRNGVGVFLRNAAYDTAAATQSATLTGNTVAASGQFGRGVSLGNTAVNTAAATQSATLTDNTVTASGQSGVGVDLSNAAYDTAAATQTATLSNNTVTASQDGTGVYLGNFAFGTGAATQTATLSNNTVNGTRFGLSAFNIAQNNGNATQQANLSGGGNSVTGGTAAVYARNSDTSTGAATQLLDLTATTIVGVIDVSGDPIQTIIGP